MALHFSRRLAGVVVGSACLMLWCTHATAQTADGGCGTVETDQSRRDMLGMMESGQWEEARFWLGGESVRGVDKMVAMTMHVIRYDNGSEGLPQDQVDQCIVDLNSEVELTGLLFFQEGPTIYHDDSDLAESVYEDFCTIVNTGVVANTVNCYFIPVYEGLCGVASFPSSSCQGVTVANGCAATDWNHSTFTHEVGHYFNLRHTHSTWGGDECVDGSNCASVSDGFCDTPADPNLYEEVDWETCEYLGTEQDACGSGMQYDPDTTNIMSYSTKLCRTHLSTEQQSMVEWTALNNEHRTDELRDPGACCIDQSCSITAESMCAGTWQGAFTDCADSPCALSGACCVHESCAITTQIDCGGDWLGGGTDCFGDPCAAPIVGACCVETACSVTTAPDCSGSWLGDGTTCDGDPCAPPPTGACCVGESCSITISDACGGTWQGADTTCSGDPCSIKETLRVPQDYATIATAIAAASTGDVVLVGPGTWTSSGDYVLNLFAKQITVRSMEGPAATILDGQNARRVVRCGAGETSASIIDGFTITGGAAVDGAGVSVENASHPTIMNCVITGNNATDHGGGIWCTDSSSPTFVWCTISNNTAGDSGGGSGGGLRIDDASMPLIQECTISENTAYRGGGLSIYGTGTSPTITSSVISDNTCAGLGAGVAAYDASPVITDSSITGNVSGGVCGGLLLQNTQSSITGCIISGNAGSYGAGVYTWQSSDVLTDCTISGNIASGNGGGLKTSNTAPTLTNTVMCSNRPDQVHGDWNDGGGSEALARCDIDCMDVDGDADVDATDIVALLEYWGQADDICDLDQAGEVDLADLLLLLSGWGVCD